VPRADIVALFAGSFNFPPEQQWEYSNSDYFLLGMIIEKVSGQSFARYLFEHIFRPVASHVAAFVERFRPPQG
jgi:CubicO group peptidase (beta-lactamase class C family)